MAISFLIDISKCKYTMTVTRTMGILGISDRFGIVLLLLRSYHGLNEMIGSQSMPTPVTFIPPNVVCWSIHLLYILIRDQALDITSLDPVKAK